jgi:bisphosphoglycerate-independent phosphoglycerate mutase (AlkP superfamily)
LVAPQDGLQARKVIFVFLDGVGMGSADDSNPLWIARMRNLRRILGCPLVKGEIVNRPNLLLKAIDPCLGVAGPPQSATGQTALLTGVNAARILGKHLARPNDLIKEIIEEKNILKMAVEMGYSATFANAYTPSYFRLVEKGKLRHSATTLSVISAGLPFRSLADLDDGKAVYWDITNYYLSKYFGFPLPIIEPELAGKRLANLSLDYDLVLYESFLPDLVGHSKDLERSLEVLEILDRFFAGLFDEVSPSVTVVISSDHGNIEEMSGRHTANPVPLLAVGCGVRAFRKARSITDVAVGIMEALTRK